MDYRVAHWVRAANRNQGARGRKSQWGPPPNWPVSAYDCVGEQCAKHTQHAKHAHSRGLGACPPRKILKFILQEMQSRGILSQLYSPIH